MALLLSRYSPRFQRAGYALGFGLGGFFDGILLHQVLQWHHLLSALQGGVLGDVRAQVVADGLFHVLMYIVAAAGLWWLYQSRGELAQPAAGRRLMANFWIGFAAWHILDALLSHWLLGIHRIKMDAANPLVYDVAWLILFGIVPLVAGLYLLLRQPPGGASGPPRSADGGTPDGRRRDAPPPAPAADELPGTTLPRSAMVGDGTAMAEGRSAMAGACSAMAGACSAMAGARSAMPGAATRWLAASLAAVSLLAAAVSAFPLARPPEGIVAVVLRPGASAGPLMAALPEHGGRLLWAAPGAGVLAFKMDGQADTLAFYRLGALYVGGTTGLAGCLDWLARDPAGKPV